MEDGDTEKYHPSRVIQDFVFLSRERGCIRCISLLVYNKFLYYTCFMEVWLLLQNEAASRGGEPALQGTDAEENGHVAQTEI